MMRTINKRFLLLAWGIMTGLCLLSTGAFADDREKLLRENARSASRHLLALKKENEAKIKSGRWNEANFLVDEFEEAKTQEGNNPALDKENDDLKKIIRSRLAIFNRMTGIQYYVLLTPGVPYWKLEELQENKDKNNQERQALEAQLRQEAATYSESVFKLAKLGGENKVGNGVLLVIYLQEILLEDKKDSKIFNVVRFGSLFKDEYSSLKAFLTIDAIEQNDLASHNFYNITRYHSYVLLNYLFKLFQTKNNFYDANKSAFGLDFLWRSKADQLPEQLAYAEESLSAFENHAIFGEIVDKTKIQRFDPSPSVPIKLIIQDNDIPFGFEGYRDLGFVFLQKDLSEEKLKNLVGSWVFEIKKQPQSPKDPLEFFYRIRNPIGYALREASRPQTKAEVCEGFEPYWNYAHKPDNGSVKPSLKGAYETAYTNRNKDYAKLNASYYYIAFRDLLLDYTIEQPTPFKLNLFRIIPQGFAVHPLIQQAKFDLNTALNFLPVRLYPQADPLTPNYFQWVKTQLDALYISVQSEAEAQEKVKTLVTSIRKKADDAINANITGNDCSYWLLDTDYFEGLEEVETLDNDFAEALNNDDFRKIHNDFINGSRKRMYNNFFTLEEEIVLTFYQGADYYELNQKLINDSKEPDILAIERLLNKVLDKIDYESHTRVVRGAGAAEVQMLLDISKTGNRIVTYKNFLSASTEDEVAWRFIKRIDPNEIKAFITIESKNGKSLEKNRKEIRGEFEILHKSKSKFKVEIKEYDEDYLLNFEAVAMEGAKQDIIKKLYQIKLIEQ